MPLPRWLAVLIAIATVLLILWLLGVRLHLG
jgi:hypothetical protein